MRALSVTTWFLILPLTLTGCRPAAVTPGDQADAPAPSPRAEDSPGAAIVPPPSPDAPPDGSKSWRQADELRLDLLATWPEEFVRRPKGLALIDGRAWIWGDEGGFGMVDIASGYWRPVPNDLMICGGGRGTKLIGDEIVMLDAMGEELCHARVSDSQVTLLSKLVIGPDAYGHSLACDSNSDHVYVTGPPTADSGGACNVFVARVSPSLHAVQSLCVGDVSGYPVPIANPVRPEVVIWETNDVVVMVDGAVAARKHFTDVQIADIAWGRHNDTLIFALADPPQLEEWSIDLKRRLGSLQRSAILPEHEQPRGPVPRVVATSRSFIWVAYEPERNGPELDIYEGDIADCRYVGAIDATYCWRIVVHAESDRAAVSWSWGEYDDRRVTVLEPSEGTCYKIGGVHESLADAPQQLQFTEDGRVLVFVEYPVARLVLVRLPPVSR